MFKLYDFQQDCLDTGIKRIKQSPDNAKGKITLPTGAGKTTLEAYFIAYQIEYNTKNNIHLVLAPRIVLCNQLLNQVRRILRDKGLGDFRAIAFHSGDHECDEDIMWDEFATTKLSDIKKIIKDSKKMKIPVPTIIFSTYHSCEKLKNIEFDTIIADESQYCVGENFHNSFKSLKGRVTLSFTAYEVHTKSPHGRGHNNKDVYGDLWYCKTPSDLFPLNIIVPPRFHLMYYNDVRDEGYSICEIVSKICEKQIKLTEEKLEFSKILFAMKGTDDIKTIRDNLDKMSESFPKHDVFTVSSKRGAFINGIATDRRKFIQEINNRDNCLIFHFDILSEGIDVDGITGVVIMRNSMTDNKLLQTIGRAMRIYKADPSKKPQAWVSVPVDCSSADDDARMREFLTKIRNGGYNDICKGIVYDRYAKERHEADEVNADDAFVEERNNKAIDDRIKVSKHEIEKDVNMFRKINVGEFLNDAPSMDDFLGYVAKDGYEKPTNRGVVMISDHHMIEDATVIIKAKDKAVTVDKVIPKTIAVTKPEKISVASINTKGRTSAEIEYYKIFGTWL